MTTLLDCPNEVVLIVIQNLKRNVKQLRLACRRLALLAKPFLIDTVFISPHSKNMEVFDAVTQHPILSKTVKHIVYDSVKFAGFSLPDYYTALTDQLLQPHHDKIKYQNDDLMELMDLLRPFRLLFQRGYIAEEKGLALCKDYSKFMRGYRQFCLAAREQRDNINKVWFDRVCRGLRKLGPIQSVIVWNAWDMSCRETDENDGSTNSSKAFNDVRENTNNEDDAMSGSDDMSDEWENVSTSEAPRLAMSSNGMRLTGSPLARSWPPSWLQPPSSAYVLAAQEVLGKSDHEEWYSIGKAFNWLIRMLNETNKQPLTLRVPGNYDGSDGLSPALLKEDRLLVPPFSLEAFTNLKSLDLRMASHQDQLYIPDLCLLKSVVQVMGSLTNLTLLLPTKAYGIDLFSSDSEDVEDEDYELFNFTHVFPPLREIQLPQLRRLELRGLEISYDILAGFLLLKLPSLKSLTLSCIRLIEEGFWEDIVEGLCRLSRLDDCSLDTLFYSVIHPYSRELLDEKDFLQANALYVVAGDRHPGLGSGEQDHDSLRFLVRLNQTLDQLKIDLGISGRLIV